MLRQPGIERDLCANFKGFRPHCGGQRKCSAAVVDRPVSEALGCTKAKSATTAVAKSCSVPSGVRKP